MLKIGIIGAGRIGKVHLESISYHVKGAEVARAPSGKQLLGTTTVNSAVNRVVVGSSPTWGAKTKPSELRMVLFLCSYVCVVFLYLVSQI